MHIERLLLQNFRCFGPTSVTINLHSDLVAFIGDNGTGKTAVLQALQRMFGVTPEQRRLRRQDFHVPFGEAERPATRTLAIEAILAFPELNDNVDAAAVPAFFKNMAADDNGNLKVRLRLEATWTDDGTLDGSIDESYCAIQTFGAIEEQDRQALRGPDRSRIQLIYIPATRDGASQVTAFVRSRLWRAINWSQGIRKTLTAAGDTVNEAFLAEPAVATVSQAVTRRWQQLHSAGTDSVPLFRPVDTRWQEFVRRIDVAFQPSQDGQDRALDELSDGQRSLFHLSLAAAALDIEAQITAANVPEGFLEEDIAAPALTIVALEEPENNLAPFYLSRIINQVQDISAGRHAQAIISSHSPSILGRLPPSCVRHFRLNMTSRCAEVRQITLPKEEDDEDAAKFVREAVRTYPELYFARYAILGEGATEEVVFPLLAQAMDFPIDRSFVAVVPLGGRHVNHLWRLLADIQVPYLTLLDLDLGRHGGCYGRIKTVCEQLLSNGVTSQALLGEPLNAREVETRLNAIVTDDPSNAQTLDHRLNWLERFNVFFARPLDLDFTMLKAYPAAYRRLEPGMRGPHWGGDARQAVLGEGGAPNYYSAAEDDALRWYRYLFLGRGKPSTHTRVLSRLSPQELAAGIPQPLRRMLEKIRHEIQQAGL